MRTNMFSKALSSFAFLLLFVGFSSSFAQAPAPVNIALKKPATQSSEGFGGAAGRANDGNSNPNWDAGSVSHTNNGPNEFWMVNLQGNFAITGIRITNRADDAWNKYAERIVGATVQVLDNAGQVKWSTPITAVAPVYQLPVPNGIQGSFVRILNKPGQYLHMAEVEVFGVAAAPAAPVVAAPVAAAPVAAAPVGVTVPPFMGCQQISDTYGYNYLIRSENIAPYLQAQWMANGCNTWPKAWAPSNKNSLCLLEAAKKYDICVRVNAGWSYGREQEKCESARSIAC
jgi:hypothetical protein